MWEYLNAQKHADMVKRFRCCAEQTSEWEMWLSDYDVEWLLVADRVEYELRSLREGLYLKQTASGEYMFLKYSRYIQGCSSWQSSALIHFDWVQADISINSLTGPELWFKFSIGALEHDELT